MGLYKLLLSTAINNFLSGAFVYIVLVTVYGLQIIVSLFSTVQTRAEPSSYISFRFLLFSKRSFGGKVVIEVPPVDTHRTAKEL